MRLRRIGLLMLLPVAIPLASCRDYTKATAAFAISTTATVQALRPMMAMHDEQCHRGAAYDWLFKNLAAWPGKVNLSKPTTPYWDVHAGALTQMAVEDYCQRLDAADAVVGKALAALDAYAGALSGVASDCAIDTDTLDATVKDATALVGLIANDASGTKAVSDAVSSLLSPMDSLVKQIVAGVRNRELKKTIHSANGDVENVVKALHSYVEATRDLASKTSLLLGQAMAAAEARLKDQPVTPLQAMEFLDRVTAEKARASNALAALDQFDELLTSLSRAQAKLLAAADGTISEKAALDQALGYAKEILTHVATLKALVQGKG